MTTTETGGRADWREVVLSVFGQTAIVSPHAYALAGREQTVPSQPDQPAVADAGNPKQVPALVHHLASAFYRAAYARPFTGFADFDFEARFDSHPDPGLMRGLSESNAGRERWESGWVIGQVLSHGQIIARRGNEQRMVWAGQFLSLDGPRARPRAGAEITLFYARESTSLQRGFYYAFGEQPEGDDQSLGVVRVYFNVSSAEAAPRVLGALTARLNVFQVPFRFKCAVAGAEFTRTDSAVLYLGKRYFRIVAELLTGLHAEIGPFLSHDVPLFSKALAPGLGLAEDPGTGESFGQQRCGLMAEAVWNCFLRGESAAEQRLDELLRLMVVHGIDPQRPHLKAGAFEWHQLPREIDHAA